MCILWPKTVPLNIAAEPRRAAEMKVFRKFEHELPDEYTVFYSSPWLGTDFNGNEVDGECDFLIAHPDKGFLTLEIKGGSIRFDAKTNRWTSTNRAGVVYDIKNPVMQSKSSKHNILGKLNELNVGKKVKYIARHGAVFPDCTIPKKNLGAAIPRNVICDGDEFENDFLHWIEQRFADTTDKIAKETPLGEDGVKLLLEILAKPFHFNFSLKSILSEDDRMIDVLTQSQFLLLRSIEDIPRVAIPGGAGTGKSILAVQEATNCVKKGLRTLFTCYNDGLIVQAREKLEQLAFTGLDILNFHELCVQIAKDAKLEVPKEPVKKDKKRDYFETVLPELLNKATEKIAAKYDAIIVDEGQDFRKNWWEPLLELLRKDERSRLRVFYDNNQNLYCDSTFIPKLLDAAPVKLTQNLRSTKKIFGLVSRHYVGPEMSSETPEGLDVIWIEIASDKDVPAAAAANVQVLVGDEKISSDDTAVLVYSSEEVKKIRKILESSDMLCRSCDETNHSAIVVDTIRRFKGLENGCVVLALSEQAVNDRELIYVAVSRARTLLCILGTPEVLKRIRCE